MAHAGTAAGVLTWAAVRVVIIANADRCGSGPQGASAGRLRPQIHRRLSPGTLWRDNDLVFCMGDGTVLNRNNLYRVRDELIEQAGVPRIRLHDLRHSHTTLLLAACRLRR